MMKPHHYFLALAAISSVALTLYHLPRDHQNDSAPPHANQAVAPALDPRPAPAELGPQPPLRKDVSTAARLQVNDPVAELKRSLDDPRNREANLLRAKLKVEQTHGRLFQRLRNLSPRILDRLKVTLAETQLAMERAALPDHVPVDEISSKAASENLDRILKEGDNQVLALLGDDGFAQYDFSRKAEPYRQSIEQVTNIMRARGAEVTEDLQERILDGYASALIAAARISANDTTPASFHALSESARQDLRSTQQSRFDETLALTMATILSPDEYKLFMESQFAQDQSTR